MPIPKMSAATRAAGIILSLVGVLDLALGVSVGEAFSIEGAIALVVASVGIALLLGVRWAWIPAVCLCLAGVVLGTWLMLFAEADIVDMFVNVFGGLLLAISGSALACLLVRSSRTWARA